tara:strand:- start:8343 stop:8555 length:213 start_codon:yes stop_codon:yes gene_type:complete
MAPASFIRITGQTPLAAEKQIMEQLRCNLCGQLFTAPLPDDILHDGARQQKICVFSESHELDGMIHAVLP